MKKMKKLLSVLLTLVILMSAGVSTIVSSAYEKQGWIKDAIGWWYTPDAKTYYSNGWKQIDDEWYLFDSNGYIRYNWQKVDGSWYFMKSNGAMAKGWVKWQNDWYFMANSGAMKTGWVLSNHEWYYMDGSGKMLTDTIIDGWEIGADGIAKEIIEEETRNPSSPYPFWGSGSSSGGSSSEESFSQEELQLYELENIESLNDGEMPEILLDTEEYIPSTILGKYSEKTVNDFDSAIDSLKDISNIMLFENVENEFIGISKKEIDGVHHYKLQQYYKNVKVYGKQLIVTTNELGEVISLSGNYDPIYSLLNEEKNLTSNDAFEIALGIDSSIENNSELIIYTLDGVQAEYAWIFDAAKTIIISAFDGAVLETYENINTIEIPSIGSGNNEDGNPVSFNTVFNEENNEYVFYDSVRNILYHDLKGIDSNTLGWDPLRNLDALKDNDNIWTSDGNEKAITLYENLSKVYDYYLNVLGLYSYDGNGGAVYAYVNDNYDNGNNAFNWGPNFRSGENVTVLSFGGTKNYQSYLDVVSHEFTHSIERAVIPNILYEGESGALMEAYSDIGGELAELYVYGDVDWMHGTSRNIKKPNKSPYPKPKVYNGIYYDNNTYEVHQNSTVISHAFYKIYDAGLTDVDTLTELTYRAWHYLTDNATFLDYRMAVLAAARDMNLSPTYIEYIVDAFDDVKVVPEDYTEHFFNSLVVDFEIKDAVTGNPVPSAQIIITDAINNNVKAESYSNSEGKVSIFLRKGIYDIEVFATGYDSNAIFDSNLNAFTSNTFLFHLTPQSNQDDLICELGGTVIDNVTGEAISGVELRFRKGYNVTSGSYTSIFSNSQGKYYTNSLDYGYYTVETYKEGYIKSYILLQAAVTNWDSAERDDALLQNISLSPLLESDDSFRVELRWGETPSDLDSHLFGPTVDETDIFHTYYLDKNYYYDDVLVADLDLDDITSYGPETTTVHKTNSEGIYSFYVHDYSNRFLTDSMELSNSGAYVRVFVGNTYVTFDVPVNVGGTVWHVFDYDSESGTITPVNTMSYSSNPGDLGLFSLRSIGFSEKNAIDIIYESTYEEKIAF